jgi:hypothetical protein
MQKMQQKYAEDRILRHTYKKGPHGRAKRHTKAANIRRIRQGPTRQCTTRRWWPEGPPGGRSTPRVGQTWTSPRAGALWREIQSYPPKVSCQSLHNYLHREPPLESIKRGEGAPQWHTSNWKPLSLSLLVICSP